MFETGGGHNFNWKKSSPAGFDEDLNLELFELKRGFQNAKNRLSSHHKENVLEESFSDFSDVNDLDDSNIDDIVDSLSSDLDKVVYKRRPVKSQRVEYSRDINVYEEEMDDDMVNDVIRNFGSDVMSEQSRGYDNEDIVGDISGSGEELEESQILEDVFFVKA